MTTAVAEHTTPTAPAATIDLFEQEFFQKPERVDRENHRIRGVKVLGFLSPTKNRVYERAAIEKARAMYEGTGVYIDHPAASERDPAIAKPRSYRDRIGTLVECRMGHDGLYADLDYNPAHNLAETFAWDAEHKPASLGLSHNVAAKTTSRAGQQVVTEIQHVRSVDIVTTPGTTKSLFESAAPEPIGKNTTEHSTMTAELTTQIAEQAKEIESLKTQLGQRNTDLAAAKKSLDEAAGKLSLIEAREEARALLTEAKIEPAESLVESMVLLPDAAARKKLVEGLPKPSAGPDPSAGKPKQKPKNISPTDLAESANGGNGQRREETFTGRLARLRSSKR